ncbi:unnamed protein product, partial [Mesorhabditis belari]|uniref:Uncharacterized protein n=1 Tax=Mesorhabditis belari TaxID=2138241 RepID=A0AAF3EJP5_9BILA
METNALKQTAKEVNVQVEAFEKFVRIFEQNGQTQEEYSANLLSEVKESCEAFGIRMDVNKTPVDYRSFFMNTLMVKYAKILEGKANKSNNDEDQQTLYQEIDESECTAEEKLKRKVLYWEDVSEHNLQQLQINYEWADQLFLNKITQELDQTCMLTEKILRSTLESSKIHRELFLASLLDHDRDSRLIEKLDEILWNQWQEFFMKFAGSFTVSRNKSFYERMIKTLCLEVSTTAEADFLESLRTESLPEICAKPAIADDSRNPISKPQFSSSQNLSYSCETNLEPSTMNNASAELSQKVTNMVTDRLSYLKEFNLPKILDKYRVIHRDKLENHFIRFDKVPDSHVLEGIKLETEDELKAELRSLQFKIDEETIVLQRFEEILQTSARTFLQHKQTILDQRSNFENLKRQQVEVLDNGGEESWSFDADDQETKQLENGDSKSMIEKELVHQEAAFRGFLARSSCFDRDVLMEEKSRSILVFAEYLQSQELVNGQREFYAKILDAKIEALIAQHLARNTSTSPVLSNQQETRPRVRESSIWKRIWDLAWMRLRPMFSEKITID